MCMCDHLCSAEIDGSFGECDVQKEPCSKKRFITSFISLCSTLFKKEGVGFIAEFNLNYYVFINHVELIRLYPPICVFIENPNHLLMPLC